MFNRHHRGVELTSEGARLYQGVSRAFSILDDSISSISQANQNHKVSIGISTTLANYWLLPRISDFRRLYPDIDISFQTLSHDIDPQKEGIDLTVRREVKGQNASYLWHFADEEILPVCSPGYLENSQLPLQHINDLPMHALLHWTELHRPRMGWDEWFLKLGHSELSAPISDTFNDYQLMLQAVIDGQGVAIGHRHIVEPLIQRGWLTNPLDVVLHTENAFYLVASAETPLSTDAEHLKDWLLHQAEEFRSAD